MNWIDIIISFIMFIGLYNGYNYGLIKQLYSFIACILYFGLTVKISSLIFKNFLLIFNIKNLRIISFIISFFLIILFIQIIKILFSLYIKNISIYKIDNILGAIFGLTKSYIYISIFIFFLYKTNNYFYNISLNLLQKSILFKEISCINIYIYNNLKILIINFLK